MGFYIKDSASAYSKAAVDSMNSALKAMDKMTNPGAQILKYYENQDKKAREDELRRRNDQLWQQQQDEYQYKLKEREDAKLADYKNKAAMVNQAIAGSQWDTVDRDAMYKKMMADGVVDEAEGRQLLERYQQTVNGLDEAGTSTIKNYITMKDKAVRDAQTRADSNATQNMALGRGGNADIKLGQFDTVVHGNADAMAVNKYRANMAANNASIEASRYRLNKMKQDDVVKEELAKSMMVDGKITIPAMNNADVMTKVVEHNDKINEKKAPLLRKKEDIEAELQQLNRSLVNSIKTGNNTVDIVPLREHMRKLSNELNNINTELGKKDYQLKPLPDYVYTPEHKGKDKTSTMIANEQINNIKEAVNSGRLPYSDGVIAINKLRSQNTPSVEDAYKIAQTKKILAETKKITNEANSKGSGKTNTKIADVLSGVEDNNPLTDPWDNWFTEDKKEFMDDLPALKKVYTDDQIAAAMKATLNGKALGTVDSIKKALKSLYPYMTQKKHKPGTAR